MTLAPNTTWRNCYKCGYEGHTALHQCPNCRQRLRSAGEIRGLGFVLVLIGGFLTAVGGGLFVFLGFVFAQAGQPGSGVKTPDKADSVIFLLIFGIFALLIALGLTAMSAGVWQILFGRRNKFLVYLFLGLVVAAFVAGSIAQFLIE